RHRARRGQGASQAARSHRQRRRALNRALQPLPSFQRKLEISLPLRPRACHACRQMTAYLVLKYLHVIGGAVLLGTGAGIAFFMLMAHRTGSAATIAATARIVVTADFVFTATAVIAQPVTGILLANEVGYRLTEGWIIASIL